RMPEVQTDGKEVDPGTVDELRISVAETYDVVVQPQDASAFTIFAQSADRTGYARGTLVAREGMTAPIPPMDTRPLRTMVDMGMGHMTGVGTGTMPGMNAERHNPKAGSAAEHHMPGMEKGDMSGTQTGAEGSTPSGSHAHAEVAGSHSGDHKLPPSSPAQLRLGPAVDNVAEMPTE